MWWPHEYFRRDFDTILEEARGQEARHPANEGEYADVRNMHTYFDRVVLPLIVRDDWVFEAAQTFATRYAVDCFVQLRVTGEEISKTQQKKLEIDNEVGDFLRRAGITGVWLSKASDFYGLLNHEKLSESMRCEAEELFARAQDHERRQLLVTLRGLRDDYECIFPRVMYVVRRAMKVEIGLRKRPSDNTLQSISGSISWYVDHVTSSHALYPILGNILDFYKIARNVASHHEGLQWIAENNEVVLKDEDDTLRMHVHDFQRRCRLLTHFTDLALRGLLAAFCEHERGELSNDLIDEYSKSFPEDSPAVGLDSVRRYSD